VLLSLQKWSYELHNFKLIIKRDDAHILKDLLANDVIGGEEQKVCMDDSIKVRQLAWK
jgi:hypothetical protein